MSTSMSAPDLFERARACDLEAIAGTKLFRVGRRLRGECPICGASKGKRAGGAFSIDTQEGVFFCFACQEGGGAVELERAIRGGSAREAAERLVGVGPVSPRREAPAVRRPADDGPSSSDRVALELWRDADPEISGTLVETYLLARRLDAQLIGQIGRGVRFHPRAKWGWDSERRSWITAPAMLARVVTPSGACGGVHATYLAPDGQGKARLSPAKRMWGRQTDSEGRPGGVWLTSRDIKGPVVVGEGIESALSAAQLQGVPCRVAAALSLGRLQGGWLTDNLGRVDPACIQADPERPAFTWPDAGEVLVAVDRDMSPIKIKTRKPGGGTVQRELSADDRARICAGLAVQAWRAAGARPVRAIAPGAGRDFNIELQERRDGC